MKRLLIGAALLLSPLGASAQGKSLGQVCQTLIGTQVTQCMAAGNGRHIDGSAASGCSRLIGTQVVSCISAIAGKDYSPDETRACESLIGTQVVDCFRASGRPHVAWQPAPPPPPVYQQPQYDGYSRRGVLTEADIRAEIAAALEALRARDPISAERRLRRLLSDMR